MSVTWLIKKCLGHDPWRDLCDTTHHLWSDVYDMTKNTSWWVMPQTSLQRWWVTSQISLKTCSWHDSSRYVCDMNVCDMTLEDMFVTWLVFSKTMFAAWLIFSETMFVTWLEVPVDESCHTHLFQAHRASSKATANCTYDGTDSWDYF